MKNSNLDEKDGVATKLQIGEIQMKTYGRAFESHHADIGLAERINELNSSTFSQSQIFTANETPKFLGKFMVELAEINEKSTVLEPSAGKGSLAEVIREYTQLVTCVELNIDNVNILCEKNFLTYHADFLNFKYGGLFDAVIMCPPKNSIPHVDHAMKCLSSNGILVALVREDSIGLDKYSDFYHPLNIKFEMNGEPVPSGLLFMVK